MNFHLLYNVSIVQTEKMRDAHHFKSIQLLLDLLSQERSQLVARRRIASPIVFTAGPSLVELDAGTENNALACNWMRGNRSALRHEAMALCQEIVFSFNLDRICSSMTNSMRVFFRCAWGAGVG
jgi:hypothetical protein